VAHLKGDLRGRQRRVNRHVDRTRHLDREIENDPFVAVLGKLRHAVAALDAQFHKHRGRAGHVPRDIVPSEPLVQSVALDAQSGLGAVGLDAAAEELDDGIGSLEHDWQLAGVNNAAGTMANGPTKSQGPFLPYGRDYRTFWRLNHPQDVPWAA
jgi:hypothetical protein